MFDNQSMISNTQSTGDIFRPHLSANLAGLLPQARNCPQSTMSDPTGCYAEIREEERDRKSMSGVWVGLLTYNNVNETYNT